MPQEVASFGVPAEAWFKFFDIFEEIYEKAVPSRRSEPLSKLLKRFAVEFATGCVYYAYKRHKRLGVLKREMNALNAEYLVPYGLISRLDSVTRDGSICFLKVNIDVINQK